MCYVRNVCGDLGCQYVCYISPCMRHETRFFKYWDYTYEVVEGDSICMYWDLVLIYMLRSWRIHMLSSWLHVWRSGGRLDFACIGISYSSICCVRDASISWVRDCTYEVVWGDSMLWAVGSRDSFICCVRDASICWVRDYTCDVVWGDSMYWDLVTRLYTEVIMQAYAAFVTHPYDEFVTTHVT